MRASRIVRLLVGLPLIFAATLAAEARQQPGPTAAAAVASPDKAQEIYRAACTTCHAPDGRGSPRTVVGFDAPLPDFTDCGFATGEPDADWFAVVHEGGPVRALDRHMPAFGDALTEAEISLAISHIRTFCTEPAWPQGDLNLPRAFFTEKAFPENEAVWSMAMTRGREAAVESELIYERRLGARNQVEIVAPITLHDTASGDWQRGLGDVALGFKRALYASLRRGQIGSAGVEVILPTGSEARGLGSGYTVVEPFALWGQVLPHDTYFQIHAGVELPTVSRGTREVFVRSAFGTTVAADRGFGRAWSPQVEVLFARAERGASEWDVVPQVQVTLSKLQHVMLAAGVRVPLTQRGKRRTQAMVYLLWDWFDGGFFENWR